MAFGRHHLLGKLASQRGDRKQAITDLEGAAQFSKRVQFFRMEADAMIELATLYRDAGDLPTAEERATDGLEASQRVVENELDGYAYMRQVQ